MEMELPQEKEASEELMLENISQFDMQLFATQIN